MRPSFVPPPEMRDLRDLTRTRTTATQERTRMVQRLEKVVQDAGIKLTSVASQAYSKSARAMLEALISGEHNPKVLAGLCPCRKPHPPWWGRFFGCPEILAASARADALAQLPSPRHDDRSCCCDWLTWV
ncbi:hypothetical protein ACWGMA_47650 [Streptomyces asiaticus]